MNRNTIAVGATLAALIALFVFFIPEKAEMPVAGTGEQLTQSSSPSHMENIEGLSIEIIKEGSGDGARNGQKVVVDYTGSFMDGTVFDSSIPRGQPFSITLGKGEVIKGWDLGLVGMKVGETRKLTISPELAYGKSGYPPVIPGNSTLVFEVTLRALQ